VKKPTAEWDVPQGMVLVPGGQLRGKNGQLKTLPAFFLQATEVTQGDFRKVMGANPSYHLRDELPVERVLWNEASQYCQEIGGRLPTESEWEYSARAGSNSRYFWGNARPSEYAWYRENSNNQTQPVGSLKPNPFGLYDMAGNVFEWVNENAGETKVIRGASWYSEAANLDLSARFFNRPGFRNFKVGFRCAQDFSVPKADFDRRAEISELE
jgi:formylglycine-generating enzyme required for sulfatase activity